MPRVDADGTGLVVSEDDSICFQVEWADVREIIAYLDGNGAGGPVCLGFRVSDLPDYFRVDESMPGCETVMIEMERGFPDHRPDWREELTGPSAASAMMTVWGVPHPASDGGFTERHHV